MSSLAKNLRPSVWYTVPLLASGVLLLFVPKMLLVMGVAAVMALALAIFVAGLVLHGHVDLFVLGWVLIFPLGYYFLTFPRDRPIFTLDRGVVGLLIVAMMFGHPHYEKFLPKTMNKAATAWCVFLLAAFTSLRMGENPLGALKNAMDAFVLPGLLAFYVIRYFPLRRWLRTIHTLTCIMSCYVALIGLVELLTGEDLLPLPGAAFISDETGTFKRVNGPFGGNLTLGLVGLITLWFLVFLRRALPHRLTSWRLVLHLIGVGSAFAMSIMPMFRTMAASVMLVLLLELCSNKKIGVRLTAVTLVLLGITAFFSLRVIAPEFFEKRVSDPSDLYSRIAQQKQTVHMFLDHPINGVGLFNYAQAASKIPDVFYRGSSSVGWAHNNLAAILVDTGLTGFVPYLLAQLYFFRAFWNLRKRHSPDTILATTFFLYVFLSYWFNGLMLAAGYNSDLNFWYLFVTAALYKFAVTSDSESYATPPLHTQVERLGAMTAPHELDKNFRSVASIRKM